MPRDYSPDDDEDVLARGLAERMTVRELRPWCRQHGIVRERGDGKLETARKAAAQNPVAVARYLRGEEAKA